MNESLCWVFTWRDEELFLSSRSGDDVFEAWSGKYFLTCLINGSRVRSIDLVFTSCNSLDGFLHSSRKPAIAFGPVKHLNYTIKFTNFSTWKSRKILSFFLRDRLEKRIFLFCSLANVLTARKTPAKWTWRARRLIILKFYDSGKLLTCTDVADIITFHLALNTLKSFVSEFSDSDCGSACMCLSINVWGRETTRDFGIITSTLSVLTMAIETI